MGLAPNTDPPADILDFEVWGLGCGVWCLGFGFWGSGFGVYTIGFKVEGSVWLRAWGI